VPSKAICDANPPVLLEELQGPRRETGLTLPEWAALPELTDLLDRCHSKSERRYPMASPKRISRWSCARKRRTSSRVGQLW
jgi:hypothetical protein